MTRRWAVTLATGDSEREHQRAGDVATMRGVDPLDLYPTDASGEAKRAERVERQRLERQVADLLADLSVLRARNAELEAAVADAYDRGLRDGQRSRELPSILRLAGVP